MLSILLLSPSSNAPTCLLHTSWVCTIAELLWHDNKRQREESCASLGVGGAWARYLHLYCLQAPNLLPWNKIKPIACYNPTPLMWKGKSKLKKSPRPYSQLNVFNLRSSVISHLASHSLHGKMISVPHKWYCYILLYFHLFPWITPVVETWRKISFLQSICPATPQPWLLLRAHSTHHQPLLCKPFASFSLCC